MKMRATVKSAPTIYSVEPPKTKMRATKRIGAMTSSVRKADADGPNAAVVLAAFGSWFRCCPAWFSLGSQVPRVWVTGDTTPTHWTFQTVIAVNE